MRHVLRADLCKSEAKAVQPSKEGSQKGGNYVARAQVGMESDGTPKYRYFKSTEEYKKFLAGGAGKDLKEKVTRQHDKSTEKQNESRTHGLLSRDKTAKSLRLVVRG